MATNESCESLKTPASVDYLRHLGTDYLVVTIICAVVTCLTTIMYISEAIYIYRRKDTWPQPGKTMWLLGLYTVFAWTALVGVLVPRSGDLGAMIATMYLAACLFVFKRLMVSYYGGTRMMRERLKDSEYTLRSPPCCCCLFCLPNVKVTKNSSTAIELLVIQFTIVQPLLVFFEAVTIADMQEKMDDRVSLSTSTLGMISSLLALYGLFLFFRVSIQHLSYAGIKAKFICLKLIVGIDALQKFILTSLATGDVIGCASGLNPKDNAVRISRIMMIFEAFLISIIARTYYKRDQNLKFHPSHYKPLDNSERSPLVQSGGSYETKSVEADYTLVVSVDKGDKSSNNALGYGATGNEDDYPKKKNSARGVEQPDTIVQVHTEQAKNPT